MYEKLTTEEMTEVVSKINHIHDVFRIIRALEAKFEFVSTLVTRGDVDGEFAEAWEFDGPGRRNMTDDEWEKFTQEWFWRKGHSDVMWEGVVDAIRWDLREANLLPETAVVE